MLRRLPLPLPRELLGRTVPRPNAHRRATPNECAASIEVDRRAAFYESVLSRRVDGQEAIGGINGVLPIFRAFRIAGG
jgi:hypothetical protein